MTDPSGSNRPLVLIVPNFSEGRRREVIDAIVGALQVPGALLLNTQWDPDHNRLDCTLAADPAAAKASALAGARKAVELIDMEAARGEPSSDGGGGRHPVRSGRGISMEECVGLAREFGRELAETLDVPVYLYDQAALDPAGPAWPRSARASTRACGPTWPRGAGSPTSARTPSGKAGAVAVGARQPLMAFNVYFAGDDEDAVKRVAKAVRESSGGLRNVRAVGFAVPERGMVTVSMNLVDVEATPIHRALELVKAEAARHGLAVKETEIVGLVPERALADAVEHYVQLAGFDHQGQVLEALIARADAEARSGGAVARAGRRRSERVTGHRRPDASGGSSTGCPHRTRRRAGEAPPRWPGRPGRHWWRWWPGSRSAGRATRTSRGGWRRSCRSPKGPGTSCSAWPTRTPQAFDKVMASYKLPKETDEERAGRSAAIQAAMIGAANVPLDVTRLAVDALELAREVTESGNVNAVSDGAAAAQLLAASTWAALANVEINLASIKEPDFVETTRFDIERLRTRAEDARAGAEAAFTARLAD